MRYKKNVRLGDVHAMINAWEMSCKERGQTVSGIANFAVSGSKDTRDNELRCVLVGSPKDVSQLLKYTNEAVVEMLKRAKKR